MKKRNGLTLIEVLLAMFILSLLLITYITAFGHSAIIVSEGKDITNDTFSHQETMENKIVEGKKSFIENKEKEYKIEIFSNYSYYKTNIDIKKIETIIKGNRKYLAYVTNYEIKEPESPKIEPFSVDVYDKDGNRAFPWYEDDIRIRANFTLKSNPTIFENRIRWYRSKEGIYNPVFSSDYDIVYEEIQKEPSPISYMKELVKTTTESKLLPKRFYYFESRPYTLAGRLEHFRNEDRILVLNRAGSKEWQKFMEDIYFKSANIKKFITNNQEIYLDIFQNPDHPTLNLDWQENKDPEAALLGMKIPAEYKGKNFETRVDFQFEDQRLTDSKELGIGIGLVDNNNTGIIVDIEPIKNLINFRFVKGGKRDLSKSTTNLSELGQDMEIDWKEKITLSIGYNSDKIVLQLSNESKASKIMEVPAIGINPEFVGLKSYSTTNYIPDLKYEVYNKYDRNYSSHFYNIEFRELENQKDENFGMFIFGGGLNIAASNILGENKSIFFDSDLTPDKIKNNGHIKVSTIYVKENLILPSGSHQLGSEKSPGEIHVNGNFIESGNRKIYGNIYVGNNFISNSSSSSIFGELHVGRDLTLWDGTMKFNKDIYVGGNLKLKGAGIYGNIYVNGDVELGWTPDLSSDTTIYYTGSLTAPNDYKQDILNKLVKVNSVKTPQKPNLPEPRYPELKDDSWYELNGYKNSGVLSDNIRIFKDSFTQSSGSSASNIIIVAKTGDIKIEAGGSKFSGILFAPNGSVTITSSGFEGLIIAKKGINYTQGGADLIIKSIEEILPNSKDWPFQ